MTETEIQQRDAAEKSKRKEGFARWMDQPATRMMVSMIPPSDRPDILETLLQETYNAGWGAGSRSSVGEMVMALLKGMDKQKPPRS